MDVIGLENATQMGISATDQICGGDIEKLVNCLLCGILNFAGGNMPRKLSGSDGRAITIPDGWRGLQGSDGRMVPIPPDGRGLQGSDGRMVAIPAGGRGLQGSDGRMCVIRAGTRGLQGSDGRMVEISQGCARRSGLRRTYGSYSPRASCSAKP